MRTAAGGALGEGQHLRRQVDAGDAVAQLGRDEGEEPGAGGQVEHETLRVGDVIGSGTVGGGCGLELGRYPEMGSMVELAVDGIGTVRNRFVAP